MEGDNITVSCNGSGSPLPDVDWTVKGLHSINTHQVKAIHLLRAHRAHRCSYTHTLITLFCLACFFFTALQSNVYWPNIHSINLTLVNVSWDDNGFVLTCISANVVGMTNMSLQLAVQGKCPSPFLL